jgi:hypothetical protein
MAPSDYYDDPIDKVATLHSRCRINKGLIKNGKHDRSSKVMVQGLVFVAHPCGSLVVKALFCKAEGCGFNSQRDGIVKLT